MSEASKGEQGQAGVEAAAYDVDVPASRLAVQTKATGLLARLAHDLEIEATRFEASVEVDGDRWKAELTVPIAALQVVGVLRKGRVDRSVLSAADHEELRKRLDEQVFPGGGALEIEAEGASRQRGTVTVRWRDTRQTLSLQQQVVERSADEGEVSGRVVLSLEALGIKEIKGPLGAFRVHDDVEVLYRIILRPGAGAFGSGV